MKYLFYPGCSMLASARPYLKSLQAIERKMSMELQELEDWNCCGATEYMALHRIPAYALVARNLALAEQQQNGANSLVTACSACYLNLAKTEKYMRTDPEMDTRVNQALDAGDMHYTPGTVQVRHLLDLVYNDVGVDRIKEMVSKPLAGVKAAAYYGCMIVRPDPDGRWDSPEYPTALEEIIQACGAESLDFALRTHCCSGHMTQISPESGLELIRHIIAEADRIGADFLVTLCPMCQLNLDAYQVDMNKHFGTDYHIPVLFFTQVLGLAFGLPAEELGIDKEIVSAAPALAKIGATPEAEASKPRRKKAKKEEGLPMPQMAGVNGDQE